MKKNIGTTDKLFRLVIILLIALSNYLNLTPIRIGLALLIFAVYLLLTSFINFSPIYKVLGIDTVKKTP